MKKKYFEYLGFKFLKSYKTLYWMCSRPHFQTLSDFNKKREWMYEDKINLHHILGSMEVARHAVFQAFYSI